MTARRYDVNLGRESTLFHLSAQRNGLSAIALGLGFSWVVGSRMESQAMMTPDNAEAIIVFLFYCLAVHATQQERRKRS
jgi:hypothetical protein